MKRMNPEVDAYLSKDKKWQEEFGKLKQLCEADASGMKTP